jgi:hypothetical protein
MPDVTPGKYRRRSGYLKGGTLLAELTSRSPVVSLAVLALLHSGRLVEAHEAADAVVTDARDRVAPIP